MTYPRVAFDIITPCNGDELGANIAHARSLGLPESDAEPIKSLAVIANGPSAKLFDVTQSDVPTLALNGALKHFTRKGYAPSFWAACDPQALVADFIPDNPPTSTTYLVASKCHPSVFQKLQGRDVRLWHINDHPSTKTGCRAIPCASSVTLTIMTHMRDAYGYRHFDTYGWDACFGENGEHHAGEHLTELPDNYCQVTVGATHIPAPKLPQWLVDWSIAHGIRFPNNVDRYEGGRPFETTHTWAAEAQDASIQLQFATYTVSIHGDGFVKAIIEGIA